MGHSLRNATIDGIRGYLALAVLCHHFLICWIFFQTGTWAKPPVAIFANLGPVAVSLFFMITAFLFYGKLVNQRKTNWSKLYVGRVLRLTPMYLVAVAIVVGIVLMETNFTRGVSYPSLFSQVAKWAIFTIVGAPDINGFANTAKIMAGVTWTLRYEWLFYAGLPILALGITFTAERLPLRIGSLVVGALLLSFGGDMQVASVQPNRLVPFALGMIAFELAKRAEVRRFASDVILALLLAASVGLPLQAYGPVQLLLVGGAFVLIASGSSLFGLLVAPVSRALGDASYSIYLLHGIALFCLFDALVAAHVDLSSPWIWLLLPVAMILVSAVSMVTFRWVETPFIDMGRQGRAASGALTTREVAP